MSQKLPKWVRNAMGKRGGGEKRKTDPKIGNNNMKHESDTGSAGLTFGHAAPAALPVAAAPYLLLVTVTLGLTRPSSVPALVVGHAPLGGEGRRE